MVMTFDAPCLQPFCRLPNLARRDPHSEKPCRVLGEVPAQEGQEPTKVLECPLCGVIFHRVSLLALWRELRERGVSSEGVDALEWNALPEYIREALARGDPDQAAAIMEAETWLRVQMIGKDMTLVDGIVYFR